MQCGTKAEAISPNRTAPRCSNAAITYGLIRAWVSKFTTIRNPFTRAISCWQQSMRSHWIPKDSPFEFFLDQDFSKITDTHNKTHVIPLTEYLDPYFNKIKKFVKVEQLEKDLREIEETFGMEKRPIKAYNRGTYRHPRDGFDYKSFYTKERIQRVIDKYFDDFMAFDYSKSIDF